MGEILTDVSPLLLSPDSLDADLCPCPGFFAGIIFRPGADVKHILPEFDLDTDE
jgi:hypothetical protein